MNRCLAGVCRLAALVAAVLALSSCGYALAGRGNSLPAYIRIIAVPPFANHSAIPDLDVVLSEAVRTEFSSHGRYKVTTDVVGADAVLTATINGVRRDPVAFTADRQVSRYAITVSADVEFRDTKTDKVIWSNKPVQFREEYDVTTSNASNDLRAFFGQDQTALERLAKNFAKSVVTSILEAF